MKSDDDQRDHRRRTPAPAGGCERWALIVAHGCGACLQESTPASAHLRVCASPDDCLLANTIRRARRSVPGERILLGYSPIASSLQVIHQANPQALVAIVVHHYLCKEDVQYTRKLEGAFAIATQRRGSLILLGAKVGGTELKYGETRLGSYARDIRTEPRRPPGLQQPPSLDVALELLANDPAWRTFVLVGHSDAFLDLNARTIPEVFATLGRTHSCSGLEAEIIDAARDEVCGGDSQAPLLSVGAARLLVLRVPEFDASALDEPDRVLCAIENAGADAVWIAPWSAP